MTPAILNKSPDIITLVKFDRNGPVPLAIKIDGRRINIQRVTYRWVSHRGAYAIYHYSAMLSTGEVIELALDTGDMIWNINRLTEI